jgi:hypothetical protein
MAAALMLALITPGCGSSSRSTAPATDVVADTHTDHRSPDAAAETAQPETEADVLFVDPCQDVSNCQPSAAAVCLDDSSHRRCQLTPKGCWLWSQTIACPDGQACDQGICRERSRQCTPGSQVCATGTCHPKGTGDCTDLFDCLSDCATWDQQCVSECEAYLDKPSNKLAASILACQGVLCTGCPEGDGWEECVNLCIFSQCAEPFAECYAQGGTNKCKDLYTCAFACAPSDQPCLDDCYFSAFSYQLQYAIELELCVGEFCDLLPPDPVAWDCWEDAVLGPCNAQFLTCMSGQCDNSCDGFDCGLNDCLLPCGPPCE